MGARAHLAGWLREPGSVRSAVEAICAAVIDYTFVTGDTPLRALLWRVGTPGPPGAQGAAGAAGAAGATGPAGPAGPAGPSNLYQLGWSPITYAQKRALVGSFITGDYTAGIGVCFTRSVKITKLRVLFPSTDTPLLRFTLWNVATGAAVFTTTFTPTGVAGVQEVSVSYTIADADLYKRFCLTVREETGGTVRYITFNPTPSPCPVPTDTSPLAAGSVYYFCVGAYASGYACPNLFGGSSEWYPLDFEMEAP